MLQLVNQVHLGPNALLSSNILQKLTPFDFALACELEELCLYQYQKKSLISATVILNRDTDRPEAK